MENKNSYLDFLEESFPGIKTNIARCVTCGFLWESTPFLKKKKGEILSHVGFLNYPMLIEGQWHKAGALHAICTKHAYRSQGLASELIQDVLNWAKKEYDFVILFTEIPEFYEKLSFQHIQEYRFHLKCKRSKGSQSLKPVTSPDDDVLFLSCCQNRAPLSNSLWMKDNGIVCPFNALFATYPTYWSLHYSPSFNGMLSYQLEGKILHLFDIIASKIPSLDLILDHLPADIDEIYFYFSPDLLTDEAISEPLPYDNNLGDFSGYLMAHGNWPRVKPFMISPLSRC